MPKGADLEADPRTPVLRMIWDKYRGTGRTKNSISWKQVWAENPSFKTVLEFDDSSPAKEKYSMQRVYNMMTSVRNKGKKPRKEKNTMAMTTRRYAEMEVTQVAAAPATTTTHFCPKCGTMSVAIENQEAKRQQALIERALTLAGKL